MRWSKLLGSLHSPDKTPTARTTGQSSTQEFVFGLEEKLEHVRTWAASEHALQVNFLLEENDRLRTELNGQQQPMEAEESLMSQLSSTIIEASSKQVGCESFGLGRDQIQDDAIPARWRKLCAKLTTPGLRMINLSPAKKGKLFEMNEVWAAKRKIVANEGDETMESRSVSGRALLRGKEYGWRILNRLGSPKMSQDELVMGGCSPLRRITIFLSEANFRLYWHCIGMLLIIHDMIVVPISAFLTSEDDLIFGIVVGWITRIFWTLDIMLNLLGGDGSSEKLKMRERVSDYIKGWLAFDCALVVADWSLYALWRSGRQSLLSTFLRALRLTRLLRALRLRHLSRVARFGRLSILFGKIFNMNYEVLNVTIYCIKTFFVYIMGVHIWSCAWYGIGDAVPDGWAQDGSIESKSVLHKYLLSVSWSAAQVHGYTARSPSDASAVEQAFIGLSTILGFLMFSFFVTRMTNAAILLFGIQRDEILDTCARFCNTHTLSNELAYRASNYLHSKQKKLSLSQQLEKEDVFLNELPKSLRMDIKSSTYGTFTRNVEFFHLVRLVTSRVVRNVCEHAVSTVLSLADDVVFAEGDACNSVYIVRAGFFQYRFGRNWQQRRINVCTVALDTFKDAPSHDMTFEFYDKQHESLEKGRPLSEAILWTKWTHAGDLVAASDGTLLALDPHAVQLAVLDRRDATALAVRYASKFVAALNGAEVHSDLFRFKVQVDKQLRASITADPNEHFAFLSHFKSEAGTEATLMYEALERMISQDAGHPANRFKTPVFLDSADLNDLASLRLHVEKTHNLIVLLTPGILYRPWCLVEMIIAYSHQRRIVPVEVQRPGLTFDYPKEDFYFRLHNGLLYDEGTMSILREHGYGLPELESAIRHVFQQIALPFSPHKSPHIRQAEITDVLHRCAIVDQYSHTETASRSHGQAWSDVTGTFYPTTTISTNSIESIVAASSSLDRSSAVYAERIGR